MKNMKFVNIISKSNYDIIYKYNHYFYYLLTKLLIDYKLSIYWFKDEISFVLYSKFLKNITFDIK